MTHKPLQFACFSSTRHAMPGMMGRILDIGLNDEVVQSMIALTGDERYMYHL